MRRWGAAMERGLYGAGGFYRRPNVPVSHFRTSAHTGGIFAGAVARLLAAVDEALGQPDRLDLVDVGAGGGELLVGVLAASTADLLTRVNPIAVEFAPRPEALPGRIEWRDDLPERVIGLLVATEWLDNVPLDVAARGGDGHWRYVLVDRAGEESLGDPLTERDLAWLARWWPDPTGATGSVGVGVGLHGIRVEVGAERDERWARAVGRLAAGLALAVDYGHLSGARPAFGTLTGFREGREVAAVPDGSCDLTAHVAMDAVAVAGEAVARVPGRLLRQADALRALGVDGRRPPLELARTDPAAYLRALAAASQAAELTDPDGLGGHFWLAQPVGIPAAALRIAG